MHLVIQSHSIYRYRSSIAEASVCKIERSRTIQRLPHNIKMFQLSHIANKANPSDDSSKSPWRSKLYLLRHIDTVNLGRMILEMHQAVECNYSTFGIGKRTGLARPKDVTAVEMAL